MFINVGKGKCTNENDQILSHVILATQNQNHFCYFICLREFNCLGYSFNSSDISCMLYYDSNFGSLNLPECNQDQFTCSFSEKVLDVMNTAGLNEIISSTDTGSTDCFVKKNQYKLSAPPSTTPTLAGK